MAETAIEWTGAPPQGDEAWCPRCEGDGSLNELAPCTTHDRDCACNGPRVELDPCPDCGGLGLPVPFDSQGNPMLHVGCPNCSEGAGWENVLAYVGAKNSGRDLAGPCSRRCALQLEHAQAVAANDTAYEARSARPGIAAGGS